jgi:chromosome partitioning protein
MRRIAIVNQKGGVGKTTITANLGHALALSGHHVMVVDLDPQGQLSERFGIFRAPERGIDQVLLNGAELESVQINTRDLLTFIPAGSRLNEVEYLHEGGASRARVLQNAVKNSLTEQDYVLYDCPPSSGMLVANAIFAVDEILIPVGGDYLSLNSLAKIMAGLKKFKPYLTSPLKQWIELSRYVPRRRLSKQVRNKLLRYCPGMLLETPIREAAVMAECPGVGRTIFEYRATSQSAKEFAQLARDIIEMRTAE